MNLPNKLTMFRIILIPFFVLTFYFPREYNCFLSSAVFLVAYATDLLDGLIARKYNIVTDFGKLMDPIADKLLTTAALIMLTDAGFLSPVVSLIIIAREFIISGLRLVVADKGIVVPANFVGKAKTFSQFFMILSLLLKPALGTAGNIISAILIVIAVFLTVFSALIYIRAYWPYIDYRK